MGLITTILAAEEAGHDATAFYIAGGLLAAFAVLISAVGFTKPDFPASEGAARGVMLLGALLSGAAMAAAVYVAS